MRKVFLDCGAHMGSSLKYFYKNFEDARQYKIYSFEPNPNFYNLYVNGEAWKDVKGFNILNFKFVPKAVWTENVAKTFYQRAKRNSESSTLNKEKYDLRTEIGNKFKEIRVDCIDLSSWIKENLSKEDYVVLKMDIEGVEYEVINKMCDDGTLEYINEFYCELHNVKCGKSQEDDKKLIDRVSEYGLTMYYWNANPNANCSLKEQVYNYDYINDPEYPRF